MVSERNLPSSFQRGVEAEKKRAGPLGYRSHHIRWGVAGPPWNRLAEKEKYHEPDKDGA